MSISTSWGRQEKEYWRCRLHWAPKIAQLSLSRLKHLFKAAFGSKLNPTFILCLSSCLCFSSSPTLLILMPVEKKISLLRFYFRQTSLHTRILTFEVLNKETSLWISGLLWLIYFFKLMVILGMFFSFLLIIRFIMNKNIVLEIKSVVLFFI